MRVRAVTLASSIVVGSLVITARAAPAQADRAAHGAHGSVRFATSCAPRAAADVRDGVALLHSFWYEEAARVFARAARADPTCAMAHWGTAMTEYHPLWSPLDSLAIARGWRSARLARDAAAPTARERAWVATAESLYAPVPGHTSAERSAAFQRAMVALRRDFPDDLEAMAFEALALLATASPRDLTYANQLRAASLLDTVAARAPDHPGVTHYFIHAYDVPALASRGLDAARRYAGIAPAVPHARHMPSHIFTRLGLWDECVRSNLASEEAARAFERRAHMRGAWDERLHAMDYLVYAYLQLGREREARALLDTLRATRRAEPENFKVAYAFAAIPARVALERDDWRAAASLPMRAGPLPWDAFPWAEAIVRFAHGVGAARSGDVASARREADTLAALGARLRAPDDAPWATQVEVQRRAVVAWAMHAAHEPGALDTIRAAADLEDSSEKHPVTPGSVLPARELLADLLLEMGEREAAAAEYRRVLEREPGRRRSVAALRRLEAR